MRQVDHTLLSCRVYYKGKLASNAIVRYSAQLSEERSKFLLVDHVGVASTWFDESLLFGILYHVLANPILDTAARLLDLQFACNSGTCSLADLVEEDHGSVSNQVCHAVCNFGTLSCW